MIKTAILSLIAIFVIVPTASADKSVSRIDGEIDILYLSMWRKKVGEERRTVVLVGKRRC